MLREWIGFDPIKRVQPLSHAIQDLLSSWPIKLLDSLEGVYKSEVDFRVKAELTHEVLSISSLLETKRQCYRANGQRNNE